LTPNKRLGKSINPSIMILFHLFLVLIIDRPAMLSPRGHKDYNRMKYYSALKTGYKHLNKEEFLKVPKHVIDDTLYV
jgi:hypothetical protein